MILPSDGQMDGRTIAYTRYGIYAVARKNCRKVQTRTSVYVADLRRHLVAESKCASLFVLTAALNLIFVTLSMQFKFNNNVQR